MKPRVYIIVAILMILSCHLHGQSIVHPWHSFDNGAQRSTAGGMTLLSSIGQPVIRPDSSGGTDLEPGYIPGVRDLGAGAATVDYVTEAAWNMVSVPVIVSDYRATSLYPASVSKAFAYAGSYQVRDTLKNGEGYWLKFSAHNVVEFSGAAIPVETLDVNHGWNIIGSLTDPVRTADVHALAPAVIVSDYFGYSDTAGYYIEDTLQPARGYWVKVTNAGKLVMTPISVLAAPTAATAAQAKPHGDAARQTASAGDLSALVFRDAHGHKRTLYYTTGSAGPEAQACELPPASPSFDVRYGTGRMLAAADPSAEKEVDIDVSSADYPLTVSWQGSDGAVLLVNGKPYSMRQTGEARLLRAGSGIRLRLATAAAADLPKEFALEQNYPNPFNPSTVIRYALPAASRVVLKVYSALGQEVATLADGVQEAGFKSARWDASRLASGVYFYRIEAHPLTETRQSLTQVKKMVLLR